MGENLAIGLLTMTVCLAIQCTVVALLLDMLIVLEKRGSIRLTVTWVSSVLIVVMLIMLAGNLLQMTLWAGLFFACNEFKDFGTAFYHSVVNFATLGYGDIVMSEKRRLLGALEAANGVLMFGLTTGFLYTVLNGCMRRYYDSRSDRDADKDLPPPSTS